MNKDEFERGYAERSGVTVEWLHERNQYAVPCDCGEDGCMGWQMKNVEGLGKWTLDSNQWTLPVAQNAVLADAVKIPYIHPVTGSREEMTVFTGEPETLAAIYMSAPSQELLDPSSIADYLPHTYELPCGESVRFETWEEIPLFDVPCPCGDKTHWFVKVNIDPSLDHRTQRE